MMDEYENGWYLKSNGYMITNPTYQKIGAMKACRSIDFGRVINFVHILNGSEVDSRTYTPVEGQKSLEIKNAELRKLVQDCISTIQVLCIEADKRECDEECPLSCGYEDGECMVTTLMDRANDLGIEV